MLVLIGTSDGMLPRRTASRLGFRKTGTSRESPAEEKYMQRIYRYLGSFLLGTSLVAPMAVTGGAQDRHEEREREHHERYYDRDHKDYHVWDDREEGRFHIWMTERRDDTHRTFRKLKRKEQHEYWKWRHEHPDDDRR